MEEGLMTQIGNPSHTDPSRIGFLAGAVPGFLIVIFLPGLFPRLTVFGASLVALVVATVIGVLVTRYLNARIQAAHAARLIEDRLNAKAEADRQIAELLDTKGGSVDP